MPAQRRGTTLVDGPRPAHFVRFVRFYWGRDGLFFRIARGVHPKYLTPARALVFQGCLASVLALTGTFEDLYTLFIFATWIFYALATASVFWLRLSYLDAKTSSVCFNATASSSYC